MVDIIPFSLNNRSNRNFDFHNVPYGARPAPDMLDRLKIVIKVVPIIQLNTAGVKISIPIDGIKETVLNGTEDGVVRNSRE